MSQKSRDLKWFGFTLPDRNRSRLACKYWHSCVPAIESNGLTTIEHSPTVGESINAHPFAFPRFWGVGPVGGMALLLNSRT